MKQGNKTKLRILEVANQLFYQQGFNATSFSHIVDKTGLSKGNITYHFKSKQDILKGVIDNRLIDIESLLAKIDKAYPSPADRLVQFCDMLINEQDNLQQFGCPMGTLTGELSKNQPELYQLTLPMFEHFRTWLSDQFMLLDYSPKQASENALYLLARAQGISVITHVFKNKAFLKKEITRLKHEIHTHYG